ncbi:MAG: hypothetical protein FWF49_06030 [Oscillospiraceae bacterium]|nr:hypothetical protein [Oscillospiraceae bacterium]
MKKWLPLVLMVGSLMMLVSICGALLLVQSRRQELVDWAYGTVVCVFLAFLILFFVTAGIFLRRRRQAEKNTESALRGSVFVMGIVTALLLGLFFVFLLIVLMPVL